METHEIIRAWASPLIAAGSLAYAVIAGRGKAAKDEQSRLEGRIKAVEESQTEVRADLAQVKLTVQHLPTREQFHSIELNFAVMAGDMKVLVARVEELLKKDR